MGWHPDSSDLDAVFAISPNDWTYDELGLKWIKPSDNHTSISKM